MIRTNKNPIEKGPDLNIVGFPRSSVGRMQIRRKPVEVAEAQESNCQTRRRDIRGKEEKFQGVAWHDTGDGVKTQ